MLDMCSNKFNGVIELARRKHYKTVVDRSLSSLSSIIIYTRECKPPVLIRLLPYHFIIYVMVGKFPPKRINFQAHLLA